MDDFVIEMMVKQRLAEARAEAERTHMADAHYGALPSLRLITGRALIRLGARLCGTSAPERNGPIRVRDGSTATREAIPGKRAA